MTILIIDSGIRLSHPFFADADVESYELKNGYAERVYVDNDTLGHGTAVSYLIYKSLNKQNIDAKIKVIKCFDSYETSEEKITDALSVVLNDFEADLLNLSFGITRINIPELESLCKKISAKMIIVSSADNAGYFSFPCILPDVLGVVSDPICKNQLDFSYIDNAPVQLGGFGGTQRVAWVKQDYIYSSGNSYACANITGILAGFVYKSGKNEIKKDLMENARCVNVVPKLNGTCRFPTFKIKKAAVFPFNKEISSLVLFEDLLNFEIVDIYDSAITGKVGVDTARILTPPVQQNRVVKNITDFNADSIDTLILGHLNEYINISRELEKIKKVLSLCNDKGINIYSFDSLVDGDNVFIPKVEKNDVPPRINNGMMYQILSPVLGIYGTSSKQGKFTLQLKIRREMLKRGVRVGQLGTEPQSLLFSFDSVYPMGYNSTVQIFGCDVISYLNYEIHKIETQKPVDIIITGSQSSTVPFSFSHLNQFTLPCIEFLMGTCPDAVILCVNCFDSTSYIERTIKSIEGIVNCKVIALIVFPVDKNQAFLSHNETILNLNTQKSMLQNKFKLPVFSLNDDISIICDSIIDYFR